MNISQHTTALGDTLRAVVNEYITKHGLKGGATWDIKLEEAAKSTHVTVNRKELLNALLAVKCAVSNEKTRPYLNGVLLETKRGRLNVVATDGHRLVHALVKATAVGDVSCIVSAVKSTKRGSAPSSVQSLIAILKASRNKSVTITLGADVCSINDQLLTTVDGTYPDWTRVLPSDYIVQGSITMPVEQVKEFCKAIHKAETKEKWSRCIEFTNTHGKRGDISVQTSSSTGQVHFGINSRYLLDFIGNAKGDVTIVQYSHTGPLDVKLTDGYRRVFMPMRV